MRNHHRCKLGLVINVMLCKYMNMYVPQYIDKHSYIFAGYGFIESWLTASIDELRAGTVNNKLQPYDLIYVTKRLKS